MILSPCDPHCLAQPPAIILPPGRRHSGRSRAGGRHSEHVGGIWSDRVLLCQQQIHRLRLHADQLDHQLQPGNAFSRDGYPRRLLLHPMSGGMFDLSMASNLGQTYRSDETDSLRPPFGTTASNNVPGTGNPIYIQASNLSAQRFYRVVLLSP